MAHFTAAQIDAEAVQGRRTDRLYRRVRLNGLRYDGIVRYAPELEQGVPDVREYIADWLEQQARRYGLNGLLGRLYSPVDVPLPEGTVEGTEHTPN